MLNAKPEHAEREGEIVAEAGQPGAVTIATNMAGRGVDIKLGGNPEHLTDLELAKLGLQPGDPDYDERFAEVLPQIEARVEEDREKVIEAGGLFIFGTERHESRRIDNQLRGRSGRQGDPGESRFFLSAEDDLVRLFAGDRIYKILDRLGSTDEEGNEEPIEAGMLSKQIEKAQRKVEEQNFLIRKRVLEYDDVMNEQRRIVYEYRDQVLEGRDMGEQSRQEIAGVVERLVDEYAAADYVEDWDLDGPLRRARGHLPGEPRAPRTSTGSNLGREELAERLAGDAVELYDRREEELGEELMRALERYLLLQIIDQRWREHLYDMDYLREGIHLRGFAQIDPLVAYKNEAFTLFSDLMNTIWSDFSRMIFHVEVAGRGRERRRARAAVHAVGLVHARRAASPTRAARARAQPSALAEAAGARRRGGAEHAEPDAHPAAPRRRGRADRAQRPLLVRVGQEIQEVPRLPRRARRRGSCTRNA